MRRTATRSLTLLLLIALVGCGNGVEPGPADVTDREVGSDLAEQDASAPDTMDAQTTNVCLLEPDRCDDNNVCTDDRCLPESGACEHVALTQPCDDHSLCTTGDACLNGTCTGEPVDCSDLQPCTVDSCDPQGGCRHDWVAGAACDDGDPCTVDDQCTAETCAGSPRTCPSDGPCLKGSCGPLSGECTLVSLDGGSCDDGNLCTVDGVCVNGQCQSDTLVDCDDANPCTTDICDPQTGCLHEANTLPCSDSNPCTLGDVCAQGSCFAGTAKACQDGNPCTLDSCDLESGDCLHEPTTWPCDDGNACTTGDTCGQGTCVGQPVACDDGNPCTASTCDPVLGCLVVPLAVPCDDADPCTIGDMCVDGSCAPGPGSPICDDDNPCTDDSCDPKTGNCLSVPNTLACDDGNACTSGDTCVDGACAPGDTGLCQCETDGDCLIFDDGNACNGVVVCDDQVFPPKCALAPGSVVKCSAFFDTQCRKSKCQPQSGLCLLQDVPDGQACDDSNPCTLGDQCQQGLCTGTQTADCNDSNPCTKEQCDPDSGCVFTAVSLPCDDGSLCTVGDSCVGGNCVGIPVLCEDGNPCTIGTCVPETGECTFPFSPGTCDDKNPCTDKDQCVDGVCLGKPTDCDDGNPCTADACNGLDGCTHEVIGGSCDDGNACTQQDLCTNGKCKGVAIVCNDGNPCTDDLCKFSQGCLHPANAAPCDDGNQCTYGDQCTEGECVGLPVSCEDGNPCTHNTCHELAGCLIEYLDIPCDDTSPCTVGDWCQQGVCVAGPPPVCDDGNSCTLDGCDPVTGDCLYLNTGWACDDGNACTEQDYCSNGFCVGFSVSCYDANLCTSDSCDPESGCVHSIVGGVLCDDGNLCTSGDLCVAGECLGQEPVVCNDNNVCTADACAPMTGCFFKAETGADCDDGDEATILDTCQGGTCLGLPDDDGDGLPEEGAAKLCAGGNTTDCNDNCPGLPNPAQEDADGDGIGDLCESCGPLQELDGETAPDEAVWGIGFKDPCPPLDTVSEAGVDGDENFLEFTANRGPECGSHTVYVTLTPQRDLSGAHTVLEADLALQAWVYPAQFLGIPIATLSVTNGASTIPLRSVEAGQATSNCGSIAVVPATLQRATWNITVDSAAKTATVAVGGGEPETTSLAGLQAPWRLQWSILGGDLLGGCGATASVKVFGLDVLCQW